MTPFDVRRRTLALVALLLVSGAVLALVPSPAAADRFPATAEIVSRGSSTGFANQGQVDGSANVKTEGGTLQSRWLKPATDGVPVNWAKTTTCATHAACVSDDPVHDGNTTILAATAGATNQDRHNTADWPLPETVIESVTIFTIARKNSSAASGYSLWPEDPLGCAQFVPVITQAFANYSLAYANACSGGSWTVALVNALTQNHFNDRSSGQAIATVTAAGIVVGYRTDFWLDDTYTFAGVQGPDAVLSWACTTTDEEGLDLYVGGAIRARGLCVAPLTTGSVQLGDADGSSYTARLLSPTQSGDLTQSTYTFDLLAIDTNPSTTNPLPDPLTGIFPCTYAFLVRTFHCASAFHPSVFPPVNRITWTLSRGGANLSSAVGDGVDLPTHGPPWDVGVGTYRLTIVASTDQVGGPSYPFLRFLFADDRPWLLVYASIFIVVAIAIYVKLTR